MALMLRSVLCRHRSTAFWTIARFSSVRVESNERLLGNDFYNAPEERKWNPRDTTLFFDFRILNKIEDIQNVVQKMGSEISAAHLSGALNRMRQLKLSVENGFLQHLANLVLQKKTHFYAKQCASAWLCFARLGFYDPEFYDQFAETSMKLSFIQAYSPVDLSNIIYGIGLLQKRREQQLGLQLKPRKVSFSERTIAFPLQMPFLKTLVKDTLLTSHPTRLNEVQMNSVVYGLGLAKFEELDLIEALLKQASYSDRLWRYTEGELSNLLYGMVLMGLEPQQDAIQNVVYEITKPERLKRVAEHEMTCLMYALRLLKWESLPPLQNLRDELTHSERLRYLSEQSLSMILSNMRYLGMTEASDVGPLITEIASERILSKIKPQGLAMGLYNYASSSFRDEAVLERLVQTAMQPKHVAAFTPNDISNILFALSFLKYDRHDVLAPLKERLSDPVLVSMFEPGHMANVFYGSGRLGLSETLPYSLEAVMKPEKLHKLTPSQLVNVIYGLGQSASKNTEAVDRLLTLVLQMEKLKDLSANQLSSIVSSLGRMGYKNRTFLMQLMNEVVQSDRLRSISSIGLCNVLHGLAGCEFRDGSLLGSFLKEVILPSRLADFAPSQLSILMYSIGKIGIEDVRVTKPILKEIMKESCLAEMNIHGYTNVLYGLSQLEQFDEKIWERLTAEIHRPERLENMKALEMSLILYAYGMKRFYKPVLKEIVAKAQNEACLKDFTTVGLASSLYSLAQLELRDLNCVEKMLKTFCEKRHLEQATSHHLGNVVFSIGLMEVRNSDALAILKTEILKPGRLQSFSRHALHNLLFGFGQLEHKDLHLAEALWKEVLHLERLAGFTQREWTTIATSLEKMGFKKEDDVIPIRSKILTSRGLPVETLPRPHSKYEFTSEDIRRLREEHQNRQKEDASSKVSLKTALERHLEKVWASRRRDLEFRPFRGRGWTKRMWFTREVDMKSMSTCDFRIGEIGVNLQRIHQGTKVCIEERCSRSVLLCIPSRFQVGFEFSAFLIGMELEKRMRPSKAKIKRSVMIFNQAQQTLSDDEFLFPSKKTPSRERVISPWTSPYYNLRVIQWPDSVGPAKTVNDDFEENSKEANVDNPYEDDVSGSESAFEFESDSESSSASRSDIASIPGSGSDIAFASGPVDQSESGSGSEPEFTFESAETSSRRSYNKTSVPFEQLLKQQKQIVQKQDAAALNAMVDELNAFLEKSK